MRARRVCRAGVLAAGLSVVAVVGCSDRDSGQADDAHANGGGHEQTGEPVDDGRQSPDAPDDGAWETYTTDDGLGADEVAAVAVAGDWVMWAGTHGGLSRFDGEEWRTYTREDGLAHDKVLSVAVDDRGVVWAGTTDRLSRLTR